MILICSNLLKYDVVSLTDLLRDFYDGVRNGIGQQAFSVFNGKNDVVVRIVCVVECLNWTHPSVVAETEGFRTFLQGAARQSRGEN